MTSALAFSASIMCSTQLKLLVCLACFPTRMGVCIYMLSTYVAGPSRLPWGNQGELLWPTSKSSPVFSRFLSSPALRLTNQSVPIPATSFLISPIFLDLFPLNNTQQQHWKYPPSFSQLRTRQVSVFRVSPGRFLRPILAPRGASCSRQILVRLSASHLCPN